MSRRKIQRDSDRTKKNFWPEDFEVSEGESAAPPKKQPPKPSFRPELLEPRIFLSATWVDTDSGDPLEGATEGNDTYTGTTGDDIADALGGNDTMDGDDGADSLFGGAGNDTLSGGDGADILDGGAGDDQLLGGKDNDVLISGGGSDTLHGDQGDDTFRFTGAQDGDVITVVGGANSDTIDLSAYTNDKVTDDRSTITVDLGSGQAFTINYSQIETIVTSEGTYAPGDLGVNTAPTAIDDTVSTTENTAVTTGNVLANDTDPDSDALSITGFTQGLSGSVVNNGDGTFTYTPDADFTGTDTFTYTIHDGHGGTDTATVSVTVDPVNNAPTASAGNATTDEDIAATITLSGADIDTGDEVESYRVDTLPTNGTLALDGVAISAGDVVTQAQIDSGLLTFEPDANWNGSTSITFSANDGDVWSDSPATFGITVNAVNDAPTASAGNATTNEDTAATITLTGADIDAGDAVEQYRIDTLPTNGTLSLDGVAISAGDVVTQAQIESGLLTFEPDGNWNGSTSFTFSANDGDAWSDSPATFGITVNPINDAPAATAGSLTCSEDAPATAVTLGGTDLDAGDEVESYRIDALPAGGTLAIDGVAISAGDVVTRAQIDSGLLTFEPDANWNGSTSFTFSANDGDAWSAGPATFGITVNAVNDAPTASAGSTTINEDTTATITLTGTDIDAGDAVEQYRIETLAANGTLRLDGVAISAGDVVTQAQIDSGLLTFEPDANWNGSTSFTFSANDGDAWSAGPTTFNITVNPVNDAPTATPGSIAINEDTAATITLTGADIDAGDAVEQYRIETLAANGTLRLDDTALSAGDIVTQAQIDSGLLTFEPDANWNGSTSFTFSSHDGDAWSASAATWDISVAPVADAPDPGADTVVTDEDTPITTDNLLANDNEYDGDTIAVYSFTQPSNGTVSYNGDGTFTYTPSANFHGPDSFTYTIGDGRGLTGTATVNITVNSVNDTPEAERDQAYVDEDGSVTTGNVLANDTDIDGDALVVDSFTQPDSGTVVYNGDGTFSYTPSANFNGEDDFADHFTYTVSDGNGGTSTANVNIRVDSVNDAPVAQDDTFTPNEDTLVTVDEILSNDVDVDGDTLSLFDFTQPSHGVLIYNGDGTFAYTPDADYTGPDSFTYTVVDGNGGTDTGTVNLNVNPINDDPSATADSVSTTEDTSVVISGVLNNDTDVDGDSVSLSGFGQPSHGVVVDNGDGTFTYTPNADFNGSDSFAYTISDGNGGTATGTVNVNVISVNDAASPVDDAYVTDEDTAVTTGNVLLNDTDVEGDAIQIHSFSQPSNGTVQYNGDGTFTYTPGVGFSGEDSFTYTVTDGHGTTADATVTVTVNSVNDAPHATNEAYTTDEDTAVTTENVLANDTDADGDPLTITGFTQGSNGAVVDNGDGTFTYTPNAGFNGTDTFTYTVDDGNGGTDTATVSVTVGNLQPDAANDSISTTEDTAVTTGNVLANDTDGDGDPLTITGFTQGSNGAVVDNGDGTFTYTPNASFSGTDTFTYTVDDGNGGTDTATVTVTVNPAAPGNTAPNAVAEAATTTEDIAVTTVNVLANDTDADGDPLNITGFTQASNGTVVDNGDGTFTYTPNANFAGVDSFTYTIEDGNGGTDTATVSITVNPVNDAPVVTNDSFTTSEDTAITTGNVLANDSDPEGDSLILFDYTQASNGSVVYNQDSTFTYTPAANYNGTDSFTYTLSDGHGHTSSATVTINVTSVNDAPDARSGSLTTNEDTQVTTGDLIGASSDVDNDTLTLDSFTQPANGSVVANGDGTFGYTPDADFNGTDSFTYTITDGNGGTDTATVSIKVNKVNDAPAAVDDSGVANEDTVLTTGNVLANDSDVEGDTLAVLDFTDPSHGSLEYNGDGTFTYYPNRDYYGSDSFTYTIGDGQGTSTTATYNLTVNPVNDAPEAEAESLVTAEDTDGTTVDVLANDTDVDPDTLSVGSFTQATHGTVAYNEDGTFTYTPDANFHGTDSFTYTVDDGAGGTDTMTVSVAVTSVNDLPVAVADSITLDEDTQVTTGNVLLNDTDLDSDTLALTGFTQPQHGTVVYNYDGTFTYTPAANYNGTDSFTYDIIDGNGGTATGVVQLSIAPVNDAPTAIGGNSILDEDTSAVIVLSGGDIDAGDAIEQYRIDTLPANGTLMLNGDPVSAGDIITQAQIDNSELTFAPDADWNGSTSFVFSAYDGELWSAGGTTVNIVAAVSDAPTAADEVVTTPEDTTYTFSVGDFNFADADAGDTLQQIQITSLNSVGSLRLDGVDVTLNQVISATDINAGRLTFVPGADANGAAYDSFKFKVHDGESYSESAYTITVDVTAVNDSPTATAGSANLDEDTSAVIVLTGADIDAGDAVELYRIDTLAANGTLMLGGVPVSAGDIVTQAQIDNNELTFVPDANWNGSTSFTFSSYDGELWSAGTAGVGITVDPVQDAPIATDSSVAVPEDTMYAFSAADFNFADVDAGETMQEVQITSLTSVASLKLDGVAVTLNQAVTIDDINAGRLTFETASTNDNGASYDSFGFRVHDGLEYSASNYTMTVHVTPVNDAPTATAGSATLGEDTSATITLSGADLDAGDAVERYRLDTLPAGGTLRLNGNPLSAGDVITQAEIDNSELTFVPNNNWNGSTSFTFSTNDGEAWSAGAATFDINVNPVNDAPTSTAGSMIVSEDGSAVVTLFGSDIDAGDEVESYRIDTLPVGGRLALNGAAISAGDIVTRVQIDNGELTFEPDANWNGSTSFTFSAYDGEAWAASPAAFAITVTPVNDAPTAEAGSVTVDEDVTATITLSSVDIDAGDGVDLYRIDTLPAGGRLELEGAAVNAGDTVTQAQIDNGRLTFVPNADWNGSTEFTFSTNDGEAWSASPATFSISVNAVADAPTATAGSLTVAEDAAPTAVPLSGSDPDIGDSVESYRIDTLPANGTLRLNGIALEAGDSVTQAQIDGDLLTFEPDANWNGSTSFTFSTHDGDTWSASSAMFDITVSAVNDAPTATADNDSTDEDTPAIITLSGSDPDVGDGVDRYRIDTLPAGGTLKLGGVSLNAGDIVTQAQIDNEALTFVPDANWNGSTSLTFSTNDGEAWSASSATFDITVDEVNDAPTAVDETITVPQHTPYTFRVADFGFADVDGGDALQQIQVTSPGSAGALRLNGVEVTENQIITVTDINAGRLTFVPDADAAGTAYDSFEYKVQDGEAYSESAYTITVDISASGSASRTVAELPTARGGADQTVSEGDFVTLDASGSSDPAGSGLTYAWIQTGGPAVTLSDANAAQVSFTAPESLSNSELTFQLQVSDGTNTSSDTVTVTVNADNDAPTAVAGPDRTVDDGALVTLDASRSSDPENQGLSYRWTQTGGAEVTLSDPTVSMPTFSVPEGFGGETLTFQVQVNDGTNISTDSVSITVNPKIRSIPSPTDPAPAPDSGNGATADPADAEPDLPGPVPEMGPTPEPTQDPMAPPVSPVLGGTDPGVTTEALPDPMERKPDHLMSDGSDMIAPVESTEPAGANTGEATEEDATETATTGGNRVPSEVDYFAAIAGRDYVLIPPPESAGEGLADRSDEYTGSEINVVGGGLPDLPPEVMAQGFDKVFQEVPPVSDADGDSATVGGDLLQDAVPHSHARGTRETENSLVVDPKTTDADPEDGASSEAVAEPSRRAGWFALLWSLVRGTGCPTRNVDPVPQKGAGDGRSMDRTAKELGLDD
ncbi:MAG: tandem-95 repeat protein [Phycisphaerae bacterium]|nr:tandem-95 repeat protein [Phycisphaerae bacterium]